eukprot:412459-Pleurochrysis_carterae.AAC.1
MREQRLIGCLEVAQAVGCAGASARSGGAQHWQWAEPLGALLRHVNEVDVEELDELLVDQPELARGVPAVLVQDAAEVPPLQLAQAADHRSGAVAAKVAHHKQRVVLWIEQESESLDHDFLRNGLPRTQLAHVSQVDQLNALLTHPVDAAQTQVQGAWDEEESCQRHGRMAAAAERVKCQQA